MNLSAFVIDGICLAALVWAFQHRYRRPWLRLLIVALTVTCVAFACFVFVSPELLGEEVRWYKKSPWCELVLFALMVFGMAARYITRAIEGRRSKIEDLQKLGSPYVKPHLEFDAWEFSYPLFISVITFGALISQMPERSLSLTNATLSFQTGFFWQTLLAAKQKP